MSNTLLEQVKKMALIKGENPIPPYLYIERKLHIHVSKY